MVRCYRRKRVPCVWFAAVLPGLDTFGVQNWAAHHPHTHAKTTKMALRVRLVALSVAVAVVVALCCNQAHARAGNKGRTPILGWNTWCTQNSCGVDWCTSAEVLDVAAYIKKSGMQKLGYDHINLDDCWGVRSNQTGKIMGDPDRFPEGMAAFIKKIHDLGFKFGLYTDIGVEACHYPFTGSYPHYKEDAATFTEWEVDYVKFDGCHQPANFTAEQLTCNMSNYLLETGRDFWFNFHCWHTASCGTCGTSYRVGPDHHDNWESTSGVIKLLAEQRQPFWGPNPDKGWPDPDFVYTGGEGCGAHSDPGVRCPGQSEDEYVSEFSIWAIAGGQIVIASDPRNMSVFQKKIWFNTEVLDVYRDTSGFGSVAVVGNGSAVRGRAAAAADSCAVQHQISTAPCVQGQSFGCYTDNQSMWVSDGCRAHFACDGVSNVDCESNDDKRAVCPCKAAPPMPTQVWARPLVNNSAAVALFNPTDASRSITVHFEDIPDRGWDASTRLGVRDLWQTEDVGAFTGSYTAVSVPSHGTVMLKLFPVTL
eukprot:m.81844 g.81844  ORF g.81844 m.81844 type:complete len:535 (+) comp14705_c0_seq1:974-2578(+)